MIDPAVAVIATVDCPTGVLGGGFAVEFESSLQPAINPDAATNTSIAHISRNHADRLRTPASEINGRSNAERTTVATMPFLGLGLRPAVVFDVWIVTVPVATALAVTLSDAGENAQVAPAGSPLHASATEPLNPFAGATLTVAEVELPAGIVAAPAEALKPNVGELPVVVAFVMPASRPCT